MRLPIPWRRVCVTTSNDNVSRRETIALVFKRQWSKYNAGDCAGFGAIRAHELVRFGVCRYAEPQQAKVLKDAELTGSGGQAVAETAPATGARRRRSPS